MKRLYAGLWRIVLALHLGMAASYLGLWIMLAKAGQFWRADFSAYYTGWRIVRDGFGSRLYDRDLQARYQEALLTEGRFAGGILPYLNPPHATIPFVPLAWLPRADAFWLWSFGQLILGGWLIRLLLDLAHHWSVRERWLLVSGVLAFPPLFITGMLGTFSLLMVICVMHYFDALQRGKPWQAGWWFIIGTCKPQLMVIPGLVMVAGRQWRALGSAVLMGSVAVGVSGIVLGWSSWIGFFRALREVNTIFGDIGIVPAVMYNLKGTLTLVLGNERGPLINQVSMLAMAIAGGAVLGLWWGKWLPDTPQWDLRVALTTVLGLLFLPHVNPHDGLLLVVPAVFGYRYLRRRHLPRTAYAWFILSWPMCFLVSEFTIGGRLGIRGPVVAMFGLLLWLTVLLVREWRGSRGSVASAPDGHESHRNEEASEAI